MIPPTVVELLRCPVGTDEHARFVARRHEDRVYTTETTTSQRLGRESQMELPPRKRCCSTPRLRGNSHVTPMIRTFHVCNTDKRMAPGRPCQLCYVCC